MHLPNHSNLHSLQRYFVFSFLWPRFTRRQHIAAHACRINLPMKLQGDIFSSEEGYQRSELKPATSYSRCLKLRRNQIHNNRTLSALWRQKRKVKGKMESEEGQMQLMF